MRIAVEVREISTDAKEQTDRCWRWRLLLVWHDQKLGVSETAAMIALSGRAVFTVAQL